MTWGAAAALAILVNRASLSAGLPSTNVGVSTNLAVGFGPDADGPLLFFSMGRGGGEALEGEEGC